MEHSHTLCQFNSVQTIKLMKLTLLIDGETTDNSDMETSHKLMMMNWLTHGQVINDDTNMPDTWRIHIRWQFWHVDTWRSHKWWY